MFEWFLRKRLRTDHFSIICSNCIGGIIYHRLGKRFLSPTVNLWMNQTDYLKFVKALDEYLQCELVFIKTEHDFPVAMLKDIRIYFNHAKSEDEAGEGWKRRKRRVDYDRLYLIMYDRDQITEKDIREFGEIPCKNRVVFSERTYPGIDYVVTIKPSSRPFGAQYLDKDWLGIRTFEKHFDFVAWLNQGSKKA